MTISEIRKLVDVEFGALSNRFEVTEFSVEEAVGAQSSARPGVYLFWKDGEVLKVGRHLVNPRTRALEHIRDDTGGIMKAEKGSKDCRMVLFIAKDLTQDIHWVAALEVFLEMKLAPKVRSGRIC